MGTAFALVALGIAAAPSFKTTSPDGNWVLEQAQAVNGTLALSLTKSSGESVWTGGSPLPFEPMSIDVGKGGSVAVIYPWGSEETSPVLQFLTSSGSSGKTYTEVQLFPQLSKYVGTDRDGSIWWVESPEFLVVRSGQNFLLTTEHGTSICFDMQSGARVNEELASAQAELRTLNRGRLSDENWRVRNHSALLAGCLKDKEAVPALKRLLQDPYEQILDQSRDGSLPPISYYPVRASAAESLRLILGQAPKTT